MTRATLTAKMAAIAHAMPRHTFGGSRFFFRFDHSATDCKALKNYFWIFNMDSIRKENSKFNRKRCFKNAKNVHLALFSHRLGQLTGLNLLFSGTFLRDAASNFWAFGEKSLIKS
jgi:hypothetical protein